VSLSKPELAPRWRRSGLPRADKQVTRGLGALLPRGLLARTVIIVLLPLVVLQAVALQLFYGGHMDVISRRLTAALAGDVAFVAHMIETAPEAARPHILREGNWRLGLALSYTPGEQLGTPVARPAWSSLLPLEGDLDQSLRDKLLLPYDTDWVSQPDAIVIRVQLRDGVLTVESPRKRLFNTTLYVFFIWLVGTALLLAAVSVLFMRNQVKAIRRLGSAAEDFGMGRDTGPIKPEGAREVRQAALAFNAMQERILRFVSQRTEMLAGISHDLRTPLTRMKLQIAMLPRTPETEEDIAALSEDLAEMERMVETYLAFARGEGTEAPRQADLVAAVREAAEKAQRSGAELSLELPEKLVLPLRPEAFRRALGNVLDNARRHATRIVVSLRQAQEGDARWAEVVVDDDGPGIPEADRDAAFRPFTSGSATGTGLGLAIARDVIRAHGGEIALAESPMGGLRAVLRLPG
jgi:two-component system osmolarity sensor histidine kinase EnvZ